MNKVFGPEGVPATIEDSMVEHFFRYDSDNRVFKQKAASNITPTDAVSLQKEFLWKDSLKFIM